MVILYRLEPYLEFLQAFHGTFRKPRRRTYFYQNVPRPDYGPEHSKTRFGPRQPSVIVEDDGTWRMWYISGHKCEYIHGYPEPYYRAQSAISKDGIHWEISDIPTLDFDDFLHAVGRPSVFKEDGIYKMFYSYRHSRDYRTDRNQSYRLGYAESVDGTNWERKDHLVGIAKSDNPEDFDYQMIDYAYTYQHNGKKLSFI